MTRRVLAVAVFVLLTGCVGRAGGTAGTDRDNLAVRLRVKTCDGIGVGSGFLVEPNLVVTNRHVVAGFRSGSVDTWDGDEYSVAAIYEASDNDLALVRLSRSADAPLVRLAERDPIPGDPSWTVGFARAGVVRVVAGHTVDYVGGVKFEQRARVLRTRAEVERGNSGGPLLDAQGHAGGIVFAIEEATGYTLALPASTVRLLLRSNPPLAVPARTTC